jgi:glutamine amidotransferase
MAWHGQPVRIEELLFDTEHSLVDQSLHSSMGAETTNGDGFGLGWYGIGDGPGLYRSVAPAWGDANLRHLAGHIESPLFLAHVRAAIGSPVQQTNCHPFSHGDWLMVHNGLVNDFHVIRRELMLGLDPSSFAEIEGTTDSEVLFHLALARGLEADPLDALEQTIGLVEEVQRRSGIQPALQASIGVSNGVMLWAVRYSSERNSRTLFRSEDAEAIRLLHPNNERVQRLIDSDRIVVSEPLGDLAGAWHELDESSTLTVHAGGAVEVGTFSPRAPSPSFSA